MVTVQWTATDSFYTWKAQNGSYNTAVATDGTSDTRFIAGKTYTGIPYSMADHSFDDNKWSNYVDSGSATSINMNGKFYTSSKDTTAHGIDCSYFTYTAIAAAVGYENITYEPTGSMLNSSYYTVENADNYTVTVRDRSGNILLEKENVDTGDVELEVNGIINGKIYDIIVEATSVEYQPSSTIVSTACVDPDKVFRMTLPENLQTIEEEAFDGVEMQTVIIQGSNNKINLDFLSDYGTILVVAPETASISSDVPFIWITPDKYQ